MPTIATTELPGIDRLAFDPDPDTILIEWESAANNGMLTIESRHDDGAWTKRGSAPVTDGTMTIDTKPLADGEFHDIRATLFTEHTEAPVVERLLRLTLPIKEVGVGVKQTATTSPTTRSRSSATGSVNRTAELTVEVNND